MDAAVGIDLVPEGPVRRMVAAANRHDLDEMVHSATTGPGGTGDGEGT